MRILVLVLILILVAPLNVAQDDFPFDLPLSEDTIYTAQATDTLENLAALFDVDLECLLSTNEFEPDYELQAGDQLFISMDCPAYTGPQGVMFPRTDVPGPIDVQPETTEEAIASPTPTLPTATPEPTATVLPTTTPTAVPITPTMQPQSAAGDIQYILQYGDTLDVIAQEYDVAVAAILQSNNITNPAGLQPGTTIVIPGDAPAYGMAVPEESDLLSESGGGGGETYVVQMNDNLDLIAQAFNVSVVSLQRANGITNVRRLRPGQVLLIPADAPPYGSVPPLDNVNTAIENPDGVYYVVQVNDTLDEISASYNVDVDCVAAANEIANRGLIFPGQTLLIPEDCPVYTGEAIPQAG